MWFAPWSEGIKKRALRYLLQRYLGQFLDEKLSLDQLNLDLYNGTGQVSHLSLDCQALNELSETQGWPFEFIDGTIGEVNVSVPWATILKDDSHVRIDGLRVTVRPKGRTESAASMFESMWSSMTSSMQLAAECLKQEENDRVMPQPVEGIERFAQTIDSILCRVKVRFCNTVARIEHTLPDCDAGVALEVHIKNIEYLDEAGDDPPVEFSEGEKNKTYVVSTFTVKRLVFEGVTLHTDEFQPSPKAYMPPAMLDPSLDDTPTDYAGAFFSCQPPSDGAHSSKDEKPNEDASPTVVSDPILFARLAGRQEIRLKMKQSEEASGPKVDFELMLGSITAILSPRQFHSLVELINGLTEHQADNSRSHKNTCVESKPMRKQDFEQVEAQLTGGLSRLTGEHGISYLLNKNQWSTPNIDDSDRDDEKFLPLVSKQDKVMLDSFTTTGSMTSSMTSNASSLSTAYRSSSPHSVRKKRDMPYIDNDPDAETSHVNIKISSVAVILLHEDILTMSTTDGNYCLTSSSIDLMKTVAENFFRKLGLFAMTGYGSKDLENANKAFDSALTHNHLRILAAPVIIEGFEKKSYHGMNTNGHVTIAKADMRECLYTTDTFEKSQLEIIQILTFQKESNDYSKELPKVPNIKLSFSSQCKAFKVGGERKYGCPKTELKFNIDKSTFEIDFSIVDRMSSIFYPQPLGRKHEAVFKNLHQNQSDKIMSDYSTLIKFMCPLVDVKLRFPIADMRPVHDMSRLPWWQRAVRDDYLLFTFRDATVTYSSTQYQSSLDIKVITKQLDLFYMKSEDSQKIHLARATCDETEKSDLSSPIWPTLSINIIPSNKSKSNLLDPLLNCEINEQPKSLYYSSGKSQYRSKNAIGQYSMLIMDTINPSHSDAQNQPVPFSLKKMVHESDTPHSKIDEDDPEELVIPGDSNEMKDFITRSMNNSLLQFKCDLPVVSIQLISKHLYEVIYNRINSDLILWEPTAPKSQNSTNPDEFSNLNMTDSMYQFSKCKSSANYNSDSDSSSSSSMESNVYYSVYDQRAKQSSRMKASRSTPAAEETNKLNNMCFQLNIGKGQLTMYTPVRDNSNHVLPVQQGEVVIVAGDVTLCYVGGVGGNVSKGLLSLQATNANFYHCGLIPNPSEDIALRLYGSSLPMHLKHTIYPSDKKMVIGSHGNNNGREVLSIAISIKPNKDYIGYKTIKVATGISNMVLCHVMTTSQHSWLNQLIDMFDVTDYPIAGYEPSTVITELHIHIWDCLIDYRPLYMPLHSIITLGSFSVSSNIVAQTNASNLRFIAEECALFLCDEVKNTKHIDLKKDFVCVIDLGLFELSVRSNEKNVPRVDLRASNNVVHIRTCSDSFKTLCKLITYLAGDGDFNDPENFDSGASDVGSGISGVNESDQGPSKENDLLGVSDKVLDDIRDLSQSQVQHVNDMMAEAMIETEKDVEEKSDDNMSQSESTTGVEVFFFPDESKMSNPKNKLTSQKDSVSSSETDLSFQPDANPNLDPIKESNPNISDLPPMSAVTEDLGDFNSTTKEAINVKPPMKTSGDTDDEFCILGEDFTAIKRTKVEPKIKWLIDEPVNIIENHFSIPVGKIDLLKPPKNFPIPIYRYTLCEMTIIWHMFGGNDFKSTLVSNDIASLQNEKNTASNKKTVTINDGNRYSPTSSHRDPYNVLPKTHATSNVYGAQRTLYHQGAIGYNKSTDSISQISNKDQRVPGSPREVHWKNRGGIGRRNDILMELQLNKVKFQHEIYPSNTVEASRQVLIISSVEIRDRLASSQINKFLYQYTSENRPKQKHANMVVIKAVHLRPDPKLSAQECCLKVSLLPLRFNIDQDALLFLITFFSQLSDVEPMKENTINSTNSGSNQSLHSIGGSSRHSTPTHQPPIMTVNTQSAPHKTSSSGGSRRQSNASRSENDNVMISSDCITEDNMSVKDDDDNCSTFMDNFEAERLVSENLILLEEDMKLDNLNKPYTVKSDSTPKNNVNINTDVIDDSPIYFRSVVFSPDVPIRLDYHGKRVDLTRGSIAGLLMGLAQLNCSELRLKKLSYRHGLLGFERLLKWVLQEWLNDIKRRQLPGLLGGVGPMHSLVQLFQGIRDLFWLPIEQYQRDGRLVRGLQRGASSFTTSTAMAALDITARIIHLIQATAETAYDMVSPSPGLRGSRGKRRRRHERTRQPQDIREGITNAYHLVKEGLGETAQALADVATTEHAARGYSGAVGGVLRQLPPTAIAPVLLASEAAVGFLGGVRATLAPADHKDHRDKWRVSGDGNDHADVANYSE